MDDETPLERANRHVAEGHAEVARVEGLIGTEDRHDRPTEALRVRLVELRVFAGFTEAEVADLSGTPLRTVQRDWQRAKAWLKVELQSGA